MDMVVTWSLLHIKCIDQNILFLLPFMLSIIMVERRWHIQTGQLKLQVCTHVRNTQKTQGCFLMMTPMKPSIPTYKGARD